MTWYDQTTRLRSFSIRRGRPFNLDRVEAGTASFEFTNADGYLDPANQGSPYWPDIQPLKEIWMSRLEDGVAYSRFRGPIERYEPVWQPPNYQSVEIGAADAFETLANIPLISGTATLTTALTGANNDLVFTAQDAGGQGDDITIEYVVAGLDTALGVETNDPLAGSAVLRAKFGTLLGLGGGSSFFTAQNTPAAPVAPVAITVQGSDIIVNVATNGAGAPTSTSADIKTALEASTDVAALVSIAHAASNTGVGAVTAMAKTNLSGGKFEQELSGARINRCLDEANWPADKRAVDPGTFSVISKGFSEAENVSVLTHMQDVADSELGYVFLDGDANLVFHDGGHRSRETRSTTSQATFSDDGTGFAYHNLDISFDKDRIVNRVTVTSGVEGAVAQTVEDVDSQLAYSGVSGVAIPRKYTKATLLANDSDALALAEGILEAYKDPRTRFESISLYMPQSDTASWTVGVLGREIGDRVTVRTSPPVLTGLEGVVEEEVTGTTYGVGVYGTDIYGGTTGGGYGEEGYGEFGYGDSAATGDLGVSAYTIAYDCFVESIEDRASAGLPWEVTFQLTPISEVLSSPPPPDDGGGTAGALKDSSGDDFILDTGRLG